MPPQVHEGPDPDASSRDLGDCFRLRKFQGPEVKHTCCRLFSHALGFELRLEVNGEVLRREVCPERIAAFLISEAWRAELIQRGWRRGG
jgi:hypothetical protein